HLSGRGCEGCAWLARRSTTDEIIEKACRVHQDEFDYSRVQYVMATLKVCIGCRRCGLYFLQQPNNHLSGAGCPPCIKSKGEERIETYLKENVIIFKPEHVLKKGTAKRSRFDFAVKRLGAIALIEYHGWQHYMPYSFSPKKDRATMIRNLVGSVRRDHRK